MPRVEERTAATPRSKEGAKRRCNKCNKPIAPGQKVFTWKHRYGSRQWRHKECGAPRASELDTSKLAEVYGAQEGFSDTLGAWSGEDVSEIAEAIREVQSAAESVKDEYQSSLDNMPEQLQESSDTGQMMQERIEALETYVDELDSAASDIDGMEPEEVGEDELALEVAKELIAQVNDAKEPDAQAKLPVDDADEGPVAWVKEHMKDEFKRRLEERREEAEQEKLEEFKDEVSNRAQEAVDSLEV